MPNMPQYLLADEIGAAATPDLIRHYELHTALVEAIMQHTKHERLEGKLLAKAKVALRRSTDQAEAAHQQLADRGVATAT